MDLDVSFSERTISTYIHPTVTSSSALKLQYPMSMGHMNICHNNNNQCLNSNAVDSYDDRSKSHPKDLHKEKSKETGPTDEQKPKATAELQNGQTNESEIRQPAESDPGLMTEKETFADPVPLFNGKRTSKNVVVQTKIQGFFSEITGKKDYRRQEKIKWTYFLVSVIFQHVRIRTFCSTIVQLILFMVCFCGAYGKSKQNTGCQLMFVGQLHSDKLLLKCFYNEHCKGTLKWTGGKSGTTLFNVETQRTEKVKFIDGKGEKWFGMQINNWNREDIEAHYKCWFGFSKLIVNIVNRAVLDQPFDVDVVKCKHISGEKYLKLDAKVLHTNRQPSFTAFIQDKNITKHLTTFGNPTKNGPWIETWIKLNLKLTEEDNNKTLMILFKEKIIIKKVINTALCRGNEDSLKIPCDKVCQDLLLCLGGLGVLAAVSFCIVYKKDLLCFKRGADTREDATCEREPMANMITNVDTDDAVSRNTQISDCP